MQIKIFNIPIGADDDLVEEMNHFLRANKIIDIKRDLAQLDGNSLWTFCITYMAASRPTDADGVKHGSSNKVDYKEVLEPDVFKRFSDLRKIRKQIADNEAIPAYAVFTDAELADMAKLPALSIESMQKIPGIGKKKVEKYANAFIQNPQIAPNETDGIFDGADSQS